MAETTSRLLKLPQEIKDQIWKYAFGNLDTHLYSRGRRYSDELRCEACHEDGSVASDSDELSTGFKWSFGSASSFFANRKAVSKVTDPYNRHIRSLIINKQVFSDCRDMFQSTMRLHLRSAEAIALIRSTAPERLRKNLTHLVVYVHFQEANHFRWCMRLLELHESLPNLKRLAIKYHMAPPVSYDNLLDAAYISIPIIGLSAAFRTPAWVVKQDLLHKPPEPDSGTTIETAYIANEILFEAHFLGTITTDDAIDEHTSIVRSLFHDPAYVNAVQVLLQSNQPFIRESIERAYQPFQYPQELLEQSFQNSLYIPNVQQELLQIARRHERPWFEKLQRRKIAEVFMERCGMSREEAEALLAKQLAKLPGGQGIDEFMDIMMAADEDESALASVFGFGTGGQEWPAAWQQEAEGEYGNGSEAQ